MGAALAVACGAVILVLVVHAVREGGTSDLDDLTPDISCDYVETFVRKPHAQFLWVIPMHFGVPISDDRVWCNTLRELQAAGFTLGMHGVYHMGRHNAQGTWIHEFEELGETETYDRLQIGVGEWMLSLIHI